MKRVSFLLLAAGLSIPAVSAKVINVPNCSQDAFENAYYVQSVPGDIIVLPAGSGTWGNSSRGNQGVIYIITNVTVIGQGDSTVITLDDTGKTYANGVIALWAPATFARMKIIGSNAAPVTAFQISAYTVPNANPGDPPVPYLDAARGQTFTGGFRLTDITYVGGTGPNADAYFALVNSGVNSGLIDNCRISGNNGGAELILTRGPANAWQQPNTLGSANNVFIEDCTFSSRGYVCDANSNAGLVVRGCTIAGENKVDGHGLASNNPARSFRSIEVYNNTWTKTGAGNWANIEIRGGTGMMFNNTSTTGWFFLNEYAYDSSPSPWPNFGFRSPTVTAGSPNTTITTATPHGYVTGWPVWVQAPLGVVYGFYNITVTGPNTFTIVRDTTANEIADFATTFKTPFDYPIKDQVGNGRDGAAREPAYVFNNTQNGAAWARTLGTVSAGAITFYRAQTGNPTATFTERDVIQANRDFFADAGFDTATGVSRGTKAAMLAFTPSLAGYGWWVTDEGSWNNKLPANTSGQLYTWTGSAWALKYTPYTYPHPSRLPIAPTNLIVNP